MAKKTYTLEVDVEASSQTLDDAIKKMESMVSLKKELKGGIISIPDGDVEKIVKQKQSIDGLTDSIKKQKVVITDIEKAHLKLKKAQSEEAKELAKVNHQINEQNKANRAAAKADREFLQLYAKTNERLKDLIKRQQELQLSGRAAGRVSRGLAEEIKKLDTQLKQVDGTNGQFTRHVGDYKNQLGAALEETGLFSAELGKLNQVLAIVKTQQEAAANGSSKFGLALKGAGIVGAIALLKGLKDIATETEVASDKMESFTNGLEAVAKSITNSFGSAAIALVNQAAAQIQLVFGDQEAAMRNLIQANLDYEEATSDVIKKAEESKKVADELTESIQLQRKELRDLTKQQQLLSLAQNENKEISNDITLGFTRRNEALAVSLDKEKEKLIVEQKIADDELKIVNKRIELALREKGVTEDLTEAKLLGINTNDALRKSLGGESGQALLDSQTEAIKAQVQAQDNLNSFERTSEQERRKRADEILIRDLELIRSKKKASTAQIDILEAELREERKQIEEKEGITKTISQRNAETFKEQIRLIKEAKNIQFNEAELLAEQDNILLAEKIKNLQLGELVEAKLAEVIKKAQDAQIKNEIEIKKLEEEKIQREQRILQIRVEIVKQRTQSELDLVEDLQAEKQRQTDKINEEIDKGEGALDFKKLARRKLLFSQTQELEKKQFDLLEEQLKENADAESIANRDSLKSNKEKAEEEFRIREKLNQDLTNLDRDRAQKAIENDEAELKRKKEIAQQQVVIVAEQLDKIASQINEQLEKRSQMELERIDNEEQINEDALHRQEERAAQGLENDVETYSLKQAELEKLRQEELKKQQRREKILAYYNLLSGYAKEDAESALPRAARDIAISEAISAAFAEKGGIAGEVSDTTSISGNSLSKSHGSGRDRLMVLDKREGILTANQMQNLGKDGFYDLQKMLNNPIKDDIMFPEVPVFVNTPAQMASDLKPLLEELITITKNKPVPQSRLDKDMNVIIETMRDNTTHVLKKITQKPPFRR